MIITSELRIIFHIQYIVYRCIQINYIHYSKLLGKLITYLLGTIKPKVSFHIFFNYVYFYIFVTHSHNS